MSSVFNSIMAGLDEAIADAQAGGTKLSRITMVALPVKNYCADDIRNIRKSTGMSQRLFAGYMGVSEKTVEAWEAGTNKPSGTANRILNMMEMDADLTQKYPFVASSR